MTKILEHLYPTIAGRSTVRDITSSYSYGFLNCLRENVGLDTIKSELERLITHYSNADRDQDRTGFAEALVYITMKTARPVLLEANGAWVSVPVEYARAHHKLGHISAVRQARTKGTEPQVLFVRRERDHAPSEECMLQQRPLVDAAGLFLWFVTRERGLL